MYLCWEGSLGQETMTLVVLGRVIFTHTEWHWTHPCNDSPAVIWLEKKTNQGESKCGTLVTLMFCCPPWHCADCAELMTMRVKAWFRTWTLFASPSKFEVVVHCYVSQSWMGGLVLFPSILISVQCSALPASTTVSRSPPCSANLTVHPLVLWWSVSPPEEATAPLFVIKPTREGQKECLSTHLQSPWSIFHLTDVDPTCLNAAPCLSLPESSLWSLVAWNRKIFQLPQKSSHTRERAPRHQWHLLIKNTVHSLLIIISLEI